MESPTTSLRKDEVRLADDTITQITSGETWVEFENIDGYRSRNDITDRYEIHDIVTDAVQVKTINPDGDTQIGDYEMQSFRQKAIDGYLAPEKHVFPNDESPDAATIAETIVAGVNTGINPTQLMDEFDSKHNHLQKKTFTEVLKPLLIALATTPQIDNRNEEYAVKPSKEIIKSMDWETPKSRK